LRSDRGGEGSYPRPLILVSRCLGFDRCRYDGAAIPAPFLERLSRFADCVTACPEMEIGLGVPRQPIRLVTAGGDEVRLVQPSSGLDLTERMEAFCRERAGNLGAVDGVVLKARSPSCGVSDTAIHAGADSSAILRRGPGLFGRAVLEAMEGRPVIDEGGLIDPGLRERFLVQVFTLARLRSAEDACRASGSASPLVSFHSSAGLLLAAADREAGRMLGGIVDEGGSPDALLPRYRRGLVRALAGPLRTGPCADSLTHAFVCFKERLAADEKALFLDSLEEFGSGRASMGPCRALIQSWMVRFPTPYLDDQIFLNPFPRALEGFEDSAGDGGR